MTWRRRLLAVLVTALCALSSSLVIPAAASSGQATLLAGLEKDRAQIATWSAQVDGMVALTTSRAPLLADLAALSSVVSSLRTQVSGQLTPAAFNAALTSYLSLQKAVSFEGSKVHLATVVGYQRGRFIVDAGRLAAIGGSDPRNSIFRLTASVRTHLQAANTELNQALSILAGATAAKYPSDSSALGAMRSLVTQAAAELSAAERLLLQVPATGAAKVQVELKLWVLTVRSDLNRLLTDVVSSPDLTSGERQNLISQIRADLVAFNEVYTYLAQGNHGRAAVGELARILAQPGVFILIFPKADIMLAAATDRSAIASLDSLVPTLQSRIGAAAARGADVRSLNSLLADVGSRLGLATADIAPIDSEFEPMVAITTTQRSHDAQIIEAALSALRDANANIAGARADANKIMAATA